MNQFRLNGLLCCAAFLLLLVSCGGGSEEKTTADSTASTAAADTATAAPAPVNTIITTPENMMVVTFKMANYEKWLAAYEQHDSVRLMNGLHKYVIGRGLTDTNMVMVALKADDISKAKAFGKSPALKDAMQKAGVTGTPSMSFLISTWQDTVSVGTSIRSRTTFAVKDADVWLKNFQDGKQERLDNGITDRVIGHDADDAKKISLVTAVLDTAKAFAYYKSDALKKRREAGGVVGEPARFLFRIVKRY